MMFVSGSPYKWSKFPGKEMNSMSKMILVFFCVGGSRRGRVALSGGSDVGFRPRE